MLNRLSKQKKIIYSRNFIFGVQDSLGSTLGFLSGMVVAGLEQELVIFSGVVLIFVEAFSMAIGSLISDHAVEEFQTGMELKITKSMRGSIVMFFAYTGAGFIPLLPYFFGVSFVHLLWSILLALASLIVIGVFTSRFLHIKMFHHIKELLFVGGISILVGILIGAFFPV